MKAVALMPVVIALFVAALLAPTVDAATTWTARIGSSYGDAKIMIGTAARLTIAAKNFRIRTTYTVSLWRGSCSNPGSAILSKRMTTSSYGKIATTFALTTSQARMVKIPMSIRVGTRCGSFKLPTPTPTPTPQPTPTGTPLQVDLDTWCNASVDSCASAYVNWSGSVPTLEQTVAITRLGRTTFAALAWDGGYIGVQNGGNAVNGQVGPTALFSLGGTGVTIRTLPNGMPNPNCEGGFDSGAGASCRIHLARQILNGDRYVYRVTPVTDGWLRGEIVLPGGSLLWIADLKPGPATPASFAHLYNFIEYFGPRILNAGDAPTSVVTFSRAGDGVEFSRASRIGGVCANAYYHDAPFGISLTTFGTGDCGQG